MEITHEKNYSELFRDGINDVKAYKLLNEYLQIRNIIYVLEGFFSRWNTESYKANDD